MNARAPWPAGAADIPSRPLHTCSGCAAMSTSPLNHDHERTTR